MKIIDKIKCACTLLLLSTMNTSCEDWLSVSPSSEIKYEDLFSNRNGFKDQLTGVYTNICSEALYGANLTYGMVDALGQNYFWELELGKYYYLSRFEYKNNTSVNVIKEVWDNAYNTIANVNILLQGINENRGILSAQEEQIFEGEAYALRAFLHFDVLRLFGKSHVSGKSDKAIPYVNTISKTVTPLSTVDEVLDLAIADLKKAESLLKLDPIYTGEETTPFLGTRSYHLNYYGVKALLARIYLYKGDKVNALASAKEVIEADKYPWVLRENITTTTAESRDRIMSTEAIFTLNNTKLLDLTGKFLKEGLSDDQGHLLVSKPEVLEDIYEANRYGGFDWRYVYLFDKQKGTYQGSTKLWQFPTMPDKYKNRQPLIRISELYLIAAECETNTVEAVRYLNTLREHRGFEADQNLEDSISEETLNNEITKEYRKEFFGEGQWFFYCKRMDLDGIPGMNQAFSKGYYVLPIPDVELEYGNRN